MRRAVAATIALALATGCGGTTHNIESGAMDDASAGLESSTRDEASLADSGDDADGSRHDGTIGSPSDGALQAADSSSDAAEAGSARDAAAPDATPKACVYAFQPEYSVCLAASVVTSGVAQLMQDSMQGAKGDCAAFASGLGGRNLYYRYSVAAGTDTEVVASSKQAGAQAVVRVLSDCYAEEAETGARGFSDGNATLCISNRDGPAREVVIAVGRYSGGDSDFVTFDLTVTSLPAGKYCQNGGM